MIFFPKFLLFDLLVYLGLLSRSGKLKESIEKPKYLIIGIYYGIKEEKTYIRILKAMNKTAFFKSIYYIIINTTKEVTLPTENVTKKEDTKKGKEAEKQKHPIILETKDLVKHFLKSTHTKTH